MARKDDQNNSQFDTGFGSGGTFGGTSGNAARSQAQGGGEFSSGFGGGTNAVSQIFRDGNGGGDDKGRKMLMFFGLAAALGGLGYAGYVLFLEDVNTTETATPVASPAATAKADAGAETEAASDTEVAEDEEATEDEEGEEELTTDAVEPSSSGSYTYNEIGGGPMVQAAAGTPIEVSRKNDFSEIYLSGSTNGAGQLRIPNPPPGKVYWRVAGKPDVTEINIVDAPRLNISLKAGAAVATGEALEWSVSGNVAHYRVEFASDAAFMNVAHSFATNKSQMAVSGVNPGNYFVRVGGLNVAAGRWEYTKGSSIEVK